MIRVAIDRDWCEERRAELDRADIDDILVPEPEPWGMVVALLDRYAVAPSAMRHPLDICIDGSPPATQQHLSACSG